MIDCYCCERRFGVDSLLDACSCDPCFCTECLLCSQHCSCNEQVIPLAVNEEFDEAEPPRLQFPDLDPDDFYPEADSPTVVPG